MIFCCCRRRWFIHADMPRMFIFLLRNDSRLFMLEWGLQIDAVKARKGRKTWRLASYRNSRVMTPSWCFKNCARSHQELGNCGRSCEPFVQENKRRLTPAVHTQHVFTAHPNGSWHMSINQWQTKGRLANIRATKYMMTGVAGERKSERESLFVHFVVTIKRLKGSKQNSSQREKHVGQIFCASVWGRSMFTHSDSVIRLHKRGDVVSNRSGSCASFRPNSELWEFSLSTPEMTNEVIDSARRETSWARVDMNFALECLVSPGFTLWNLWSKPRGHCRSSASEKYFEIHTFCEIFSESFNLKLRFIPADARQEKLFDYESKRSANSLKIALAANVFLLFGAIKLRGVKSDKRAAFSKLKWYTTRGVSMWHNVD